MTNNKILRRVPENRAVWVTDAILDHFRNRAGIPMDLSDDFIEERLVVGWNDHLKPRKAYRFMVCALHYEIECRHAREALEEAWQESRERRKAQLRADIDMTNEELEERYLREECENY